MSQELRPPAQHLVLSQALQLIWLHAEAREALVQRDGGNEVKSTFTCWAGDKEQQFCSSGKSGPCTGIVVVRRHYWNELGPRREEEHASGGLAGRPSQKQHSYKARNGLDRVGALTILCRHQPSRFLACRRARVHPGSTSRRCRRARVRGWRRLSLSLSPACAAALLVAMVEI